MKKIVFLLLVGFITMLGGCVPFGIAINNSFNVNEVIKESITPNHKYRSTTFKVNSKYFVMPAIEIHLTSNEVNRNTDSQGNEYEAKYRYPLKLVITNENNKTLYEYNRNIEWNSGTRSYALNEVNARSGEVKVEIDLDKFKIPVSDKVKVSVLLGEDTFYYSKIHSAKLIVYDNVHKHTSNILTGVAIILTGIIICVIGVVLLILQQSKSTEAPQVKLSVDKVNKVDKVEEIYNKNLNSSITTTAMVCHLSTFSGLIIPFGGVLGPLIVWQIKKDEDSFINRHGIAALNFHLSMFIYYFVSFLLAFVVIGFFLLMVLAIMDLILTIIASIKASNGDEYQYPLSISFIK